MVRDSTPEDHDAITAVADANWESDAQWGPQRAGEHLGAELSCVVVVANKLAGVGSFQSGSRPDFGRLVVDVHRDRMRQGIGTALVRHLRERRPGVKMMVRVRPWDAAAAHFYPTLGFEVAEQVTEGWIEPRDTRVSAWVDELVGSGPTVEAFDPSGPLAAKAALVIHEWMMRHHGWIPMSPISAEAAIRRYLVPGLAGTHRAVRVGSEVVAAGVLLNDPFDSRKRGAHLVYLGSRSGPDEPEVVRALLAHLLRVARNTDRPVQVEVQHHNSAFSNAIAELDLETLFHGLTIYVR